MPRCGGRVILSERLPWKTLLLQPLHVVEGAFGFQDKAQTERAVPYELAVEPTVARIPEQLDSESELESHHE